MPGPHAFSLAAWEVGLLASTTLPRVPGPPSTFPCVWSAGPGPARDQITAHSTEPVQGGEPSAGPERGGTGLQLELLPGMSTATRAA